MNMLFLHKKLQHFCKCVCFRHVKEIRIFICLCTTIFKTQLSLIKTKKLVYIYIIVQLGWERLDKDLAA